MDERYQEWRQQVAELFRHAVRTDDAVTVSTSPDGRFELAVSVYSTGPHTSAYSRGVVTRVADGKCIADVKRNHALFWHCWVEHPNGRQYLLCGEDYQGYSAINLTDGQTHVHFPEEAHDGMAFCWVAAHPSPDKLVLAVEGCYWACPAEVVFFDFRTPEALPYRELGRFTEVIDYEGWTDDQTFAFTRELVVRASDGVRYEDLPEDEQARLDANEDLTEVETERLQYRCTAPGD